MKIIVWSKGAQGGRGMEIEAVYEGEARSIFPWAVARARDARRAGERVSFEVYRAPEHTAFNCHLAAQDYLRGLVRIARAA